MMKQTEKKEYNEPAFLLIPITMNNFLLTSGDITGNDLFNDSFGQSF